MDSLKIQNVPMTASSNITAANTNSKLASSGQSVPTYETNNDNYGNVGVNDDGAAGDGTTGFHNTKSALKTYGDKGGSSFDNDSKDASVPNSSAAIPPGKYKYSAGAITHVPSSYSLSSSANTAGATGGGDAPYLGTSGSNFYAGAVAVGYNNVTVYPKYSEYNQYSTEINATGAGSTGLGHTVRYSRKVFVGGLPPDINEDEIVKSFKHFGPLVVDWPHKITSKSEYPPKGYAFLIFQQESHVQHLIESCITDQYKLYLSISSSAIKDKPVEIRPWRLSDASYILDSSMSIDPRKTVFIGGVPRPLKAYELAMLIHRAYGGVCYAGIDTDPELKYPKGAARVSFSNRSSYIAALSARFIQLQYGDFDKRVEIKPYVLSNQMCDECKGQLCSGRYAPFFCTNITCLQYYCGYCWAVVHARPGREFHKPYLREAHDRSRYLSQRRY